MTQLERKNRRTGLIPLQLSRCRLETAHCMYTALKLPSLSGDGCVDKPLSTLWRNHISSEKPDILMKMTVVGSGLRAVTKEHGLTEYWANRITYCAAHPSYPRVFCWIYRSVLPTSQLSAPLKDASVLSVSGSLRLSANGSDT